MGVVTIGIDYLPYFNTFLLVILVILGLFNTYKCEMRVKEKNGEK